MPTPPLDLTIKQAALKAVIQADFRVDVAAHDLKMGKSTLYRWLWDWELTPPMVTNKSAPLQVTYREYAARCQAIRDAYLAVSSAVESYR